MKNYEPLNKLICMNMYFATDIDVFITKYFAFHPLISYMTTSVGRSAYSTVFNINSLRRIAKNVDWKYANLSDIRSS
jgi:hypothetical protein